MVLKIGVRVQLPISERSTNVVQRDDTHENACNRPYGDGVCARPRRKGVAVKYLRHGT